MPFTFSHPALVLPLTRLPQRWYSLTGLVVGSMVPDFEYFIRMDVLGIYGHSLAGLFWFDLPLGLLLCFIYHDLVRNPLLANLPFIFRSRLEQYSDFNWDQSFRRRIAIVIISVLVGSATHLFWDGFTHRYGFFARHSNYLLHTVRLGSLHISRYGLLQHGSSIVGGIIVLVATLSIPAQSPRGRIQPSFWIVFGLIAASVTAYRIATGLDVTDYIRVIINLISASIIGLLASSLVFRRQYRR